MRGIASLYLACATVAAIIAGTPAQAYQAPVEETRVALGDPVNRDRDINAETELYCLALAVYFEGGSTEESEEGQRHIANVVVSRARANRQIWGGSKICDVVFYQRNKVCQFSFACLKREKRTVRGGPLWRYSMQIARDELEGRGLEDRLLRYYMNASLTPAKNACRFRKEFVPVVQAGRHEFFREATRAERRALEKAEHEECKKYEASLKRKKGSKHAKNGKAGKNSKVASGRTPSTKSNAVTAARKIVPGATAAKTTGGAVAAAKTAGPAAAKKAAPPRKIAKR